MASHDHPNSYSSSQSYAPPPSAPPLPESHGQGQPPYHSPPPYSHHGQHQPPPSSSFPYNPSGQHSPSSPYKPSAQHPPSSSPYSPSGQHPPSSPFKPSGQHLPSSPFNPSGQHQPNYSQSQSSSSYGYPTSVPTHGGGGGGYFPPGTHPEIIRSFQMVDKDQSGFIDERELQEALSMGYQKFSLGTVRLLMFLFKNPNETLKIGPNEFAALWSCLGQWRAIFEKFDRDRSGKIDSMELRDALYSLGYRVPDSVLQVLISKYDDGSGRRGELNFDSFIECGMIVKGLTEKFKEKDPRYTGSATLSYETFMSMVLPFIVS